VVGRLLPTEKNPQPKVYRMKLFGENPTLAKSRFWFFMSRLRRCKKANGEVLAVNEVRAGSMPSRMTRERLDV
jgi:large subunit ribosomal protein L18Ae